MPQNANPWAEMSEEWDAEENGRPIRRTVNFAVVFDDSAMDLGDDFNINSSQPVDSDSQKSEEDQDIIPLAYGVTLRKDPRSTVSYEEVVKPSPPVIPLELTRRFKVHVDYPDPKTSIKARLGLGMNHGPSIKEEGELPDDSDEEGDEDDEDFDNEKDNLDGGWSKRLIGPRMKMYADEEDEKKKKQSVMTRITKSRSRSSSSDSRDQRSLAQLKRIHSHGIHIGKKHGSSGLSGRLSGRISREKTHGSSGGLSGRIEKGHHGTGRIPISERLGQRVRR